MFPCPVYVHEWEWESEWEREREETNCELWRWRVANHCVSMPPKKSEKLRVSLLLSVSLSLSHSLPFFVLWKRDCLSRRIRFVLCRLEFRFQTKLGKRAREWIVSSERIVRSLYIIFPSFFFVGIWKRKQNQTKRDRKEGRERENVVVNCMNRMQSSSSLLEIYIFNLLCLFFGHCNRSKVACFELLYARLEEWENVYQSLVIVSLPLAFFF